MTSTLKGVGAAVGRIMLCAIFLMSALGNKIPNFSGTAKYMAAEGVPFPEVALAGAIVFLIVGSLSVIVGYEARFGATLLLAFLALATWYFHDFWNMEAAKQQEQTIQFMKNLSLAGAMLFIVANGPGPMSFDNRAAKHPPQVA